MTTRIVGVFVNREQAEQANQGLLDYGISQETISFITGASEQTREAASTGAAQSTAVAAGSGALAATSFASLLVPFIGPLLAVGPLAAAGVVAGSANSDRAEVLTQIETTLIHNGLTEGQAQAYASQLLEGNSIVAVEIADDHVNDVADIFHRHGGTGLDYRSIDGEAL